MRDILEKVLGEMTANGVEGHIDNSDGTDTLRILPSGLGPDEDAVVVMEICKIPLQLGEASYYQFYTTIFQNIEPEKLTKIFAELNEINLGVLLGNFGILTQHSMLYHKYIMRAEACPEDKLSKIIINTIADILAIIDDSFVELVKAIN